MGTLVGTVFRFKDRAVSLNGTVIRISLKGKKVSFRIAPGIKFIEFSNSLDWSTCL